MDKKICLLNLIGCIFLAKLTSREVAKCDKPWEKINKFRYMLFWAWAKMGLVVTYDFNSIEYDRLRTRLD